MGGMFSQVCRLEHELHKLERHWGLEAHVRAMKAPDWKPTSSTHCKGRVVLVTAADSPLGTSVTCALARAGATVHMVCASEAVGQELRSRLAM